MRQDLIVNHGKWWDIYRLEQGGKHYFWVWREKIKQNVCHSLCGPWAHLNQSACCPGSSCCSLEQDHQLSAEGSFILATLRNTFLLWFCGTQGFVTAFFPWSCFYSNLSCSLSSTKPAHNLNGKCTAATFLAAEGDIDKSVADTSKYWAEPLLLIWSALPCLLWHVSS